MELADPSRVNRQPPHSIEAEQGVLGCIFLSPNECVGDCIGKFRSGSEVFYDLRHRTIYETVVEMFDRKQAIDIITVQQVLRDRQQLDSVGGVAYLASLPDAVPSAANLGYYVDIAREKYILRRMIGTCTEVVSRAYDHQGEVDELLDEVERDVLKIAEERVEQKSSTIKDLVHAAINRIEEYHQNQGGLTGIGTGFPDLDRMTTGLHPGEMIVIAARPSIGKTSLAMNIAETVAIDQKLPVGVFSLEMTAEQLVLRMLCSRSRVNLRNITSGFLAERDFPKLTGTAGKLAAAPLFIDDSPALSILQMRAKARRMHQQHGIKLFVIDYLQLLHSTSRRTENRQQEIADISSGVKALAKELDVPVVALSQLNRGLESRTDKRPMMSDLRESGAIEQDADVIMFVYREAVYCEKCKNKELTCDENHERNAEIIIGKQRNGPIGTVNMVFMGEYTKFENQSKRDDY